jgi:hypothetical protein
MVLLIKKKIKIFIQIFIKFLPTQFHWTLSLSGERRRQTKGGRRAYAATIFLPRVESISYFLEWLSHSVPRAPFLFQVLFFTISYQ